MISYPQKTFRTFLQYFVASLFFLTAPVSGQLSDSDRQEEIIFNDQVEIGSGKQYQIPFATRTNFRNGRIAGNVQAIGGSGNDIRVLVMKNKNVIYNSGQRRSVVMSVDISEPGRYVLVFDNSFSLLSAKTVTGRISFVHWGVDVEKNAAERREAQDRYQKTVAIISRLYKALKADERVWGTSQMFAQPRVIPVDDRTINAAASSNNTIRVNRGLYDFTDSVGDEKGDDVLAAVLAHEMSHLFYRHPGYGTGKGLKSIFDELQGISALDRVQEQEADILGTRLMCQAGFDPRGMLILMKKFIEIDPSASSFARTHPVGAERYKYLQGEVSKCELFQSKTEKSDSRMAENRPIQEGAASAPTKSQQLLPSNTPTSAVFTTIWKLAQDPTSRWKLKIEETYIYAERIMLREQSELGDFDTVEIRKQGDIFKGKQHIKATVKVRTSGIFAEVKPQTCTWDFEAEITSITSLRIEGRWEGYPRGTHLDGRQCKFVGDRTWEDFTWIPAE
jgi:hypothetical protein